MIADYFSGHTCDTDIDDCASEPCKNNGTCTDLVNDYNCTCTDEWMGETCETAYDACTPHFQNCKNGATCTTTPPSREFHCACVPGFSGNDCRENIDDCVHHNCTAPHICFDEINGFHCACPTGECMACCLMSTLLQTGGGVQIFFFFLHKNICCGCSLEVPCQGTSNEHPQYMFSWRNKKKYQHFLAPKKSILSGAMCLGAKIFIVFTLNIQTP